MIEARGIGKRFGLRWVLRGASFDVASGEVVGLLGANGSGKSTLLRVLATLLKPTAGSAAVRGFDVARTGADARAALGYLAHAPGVYDDLTARENVLFAADMLGAGRDRVDDVLARAGLSDVAHERVRGFSAGMQRRLALARLMLRPPSVLLFDEPYANLDSQGVSLMNAFIASVVEGGGAAVLALHETAPARGVLTRQLTLADGRINVA
jgi:heme exporter protein A